MPLGKQVQDKHEALVAVEASNTTTSSVTTSCDFGMVLGTNGLCYYPANEEWNW